MFVSECASVCEGILQYFVPCLIAHNGRSQQHWADMRSVLVINDDYVTAGKARDLTCV